MKIALFLGAGASVPYGMPTTADLWDKIKQGGLDFPRKDLLASDQFPDIEHVLLVLDQLFGFLQSQAGRLYGEFMRSPPDGEEYDPREVLLPAKKFNAYVKSSRTSKDTIEQVITKYYRWTHANTATAEKILGRLFDLARSSDGRITVFTTNYDTVIEEYSKKPGRNIELVDGFNFDDIKRVIAWDGDFAPRNDALPTKVILYKLHGSMNWLAGAAGDRSSLLQKPDTDASDDRARDMYIRPSLDTKDEATQREPYATILRMFRQALPSFDVCIVIGYSFRDPHISGELVRFAKSGKLLVLLSPTATSDFETNALKGERPTRKKGRWRGNDTIRVMELGPEDTHGGVCALNERLDTGMLDTTTDVIKSIIVKCVSGRGTAAGGK